MLGEFALGQFFGGAIEIDASGDLGVTLALGAEPAAALIAHELGRTRGRGFAAQSARDFVQLNILGSDGVVGSEVEVVRDVGRAQIVGDNGVPTHGKVVSCRLPVARGSLRKGHFGRGVDIEVGREAVFSGEIDGRCGDVGVIGISLPLLGMQKELAGGNGAAAPKTAAVTAKPAKAASKTVKAKKAAPKKAATEKK